MTTKIGLPENRNRLRGLGYETAKSQSFDEGYNAGFDAGVAWQKAQQELEIKKVEEWSAEIVLKQVKRTHLTTSSVLQNGTRSAEDVNVSTRLVKGT